MAALFFVFAYRGSLPEGGFHDLIAVEGDLTCAEERAATYRRTGFLNDYSCDYPQLNIWRLEDGKTTELRTWELRRVDGADVWRELGV